MFDLIYIFIGVEMGSLTMIPMALYIMIFFFPDIPTCLDTCLDT